MNPVQAAALVAVPLGVVTAIKPLLAPAGTVAVIWLKVAVKVAGVAPNFTAVTFSKPCPLIVTLVPT